MLRTLLCLAVLTATAHADGVETYALVVGSNAAGPGQAELRYAEDDARRVGALLTELGGYAPASVDVLVHPTPAALRERLARLQQRVAADAAAGKQARVFFYYSGHARAAGIDLGLESMPLAELRQRLFAVPATLTVVVLDACQSGAFSRVKGAQPAADFSFNSRQQLDATGVAVLASSSGSELSQESEQLRSSYFTHHLLVGMRGAGDANRDGQVSVDEAYRYAYHQTLLATAATAVGGQHVTLEVDLKGHGEVPLSFPRTASATIELPAALEGHTLVSDKRAKAVVAETHKAKGAAVRIAVAPGDYEVLVREGTRLRRCQVVAPGAGGNPAPSSAGGNPAPSSAGGNPAPSSAGGNPAIVDLARCTTEAITDGGKKGGAFVPSWRIELAAAIGRESRDDFVQTLRDFGFAEDGGADGTLALQVGREVWLGGAYTGYLGALAMTASAGSWSRDTELMPLRFSWGTITLAATGRIEHPVWGRLAGYAEGFLGLGIGTSRFIDQDDVTTTEHDVGYALGAGGGLTLRDTWLGGTDFSLGARYSREPVVANDIGQTHDSGGFYVGLSAAYRIGGKR